MTFFEAKEITMNFGGLTAVNKVNFNIEKGMIASVIGPTARARPPSSIRSPAYTPPPADR